MISDVLRVDDYNAPQALAVRKDFIVVYKPPKLHSSPLGGGESLLDWCARNFPETLALPGRKAGEGGLLHRLDFETHGLLLFARTGSGMESLMDQQGREMIIKEYSALASESKGAQPGFPDAANRGPLIESSFRPYGRGRKAVRPIAPFDCANETGARKPVLYATEIVEKRRLDPLINSFRLRICRGFRHQIRCHLAWIGQPIINDPIYGGAFFENGLLGLRACSLSFTDPDSNQKMRFEIPPLEPGFTQFSV